MRARDGAKRLGGEEERVARARRLRVDLGRARHARAALELIHTGWCTGGGGEGSGRAKDALDCFWGKEKPNTFPQPFFALQRAHHPFPHPAPPCLYPQDTRQSTLSTGAAPQCRPPRQQQRPRWRRRTRRTLPRRPRRAGAQRPHPPPRRPRAPLQHHACAACRRAGARGRLSRRSALVLRKRARRRGGNGRKGPGTLEFGSGGPTPDHRDPRLVVARPPPTQGITRQLMRAQ
jgi:hypothetical protein